MAQTLVTNFAQAKLALCDYINRPPDEKVGDISSLITIEDIAGQEINKAVRWGNRRHPWKYTEKIVTFKFPSGCDFIKISTACEDVILGVINAELVTGINVLFGTPIKVTSFSDLEEERWTHDNESGHHHHNDLGDSDIDSHSQQNHRSWVNHNFKHYLYCLGENLGLYPAPAQEVFIRLHYRALLKPFLLDGNSNFFLTVGWDWTQSRAAHRMGVYLKEDTRFEVTAAMMGDEWESFLNWDEQVKYSRPITFG